MYRQLLENYIAAFAEETPAASVGIWADCDIGDESTVGIIVERNQEEPLWIFRDSFGNLIARINVGRL